MLRVLSEIGWVEMAVGQNRYPKWSPGKWSQGLKPAVRFLADICLKCQGHESVLGVPEVPQKESEPNLIFPRSSSREVRVRVPPFSVIYFWGTLPPRKGSHGTTGGIRDAKSKNKGAAKWIEPPRKRLVKQERRREVKHVCQIKRAPLNTSQISLT